MTKFSLVLAVLTLVLVVEINCYKIIQPTYRPPHTSRPIIRTARDVDHLSPVTDRMLNLELEHYRVERSLGTPGRGRVGSNDRGNNGGSRGHDTGATHPGSNRRNARSLRSGLPDFATTPPFNPKPWPGFPKPSRPRFPMYA